MDRAARLGAAAHQSSVPRLVAALVLAVASAAGIAPPLLAAGGAGAASSNGAARLRAFSGGVMLSLAFLHLLADAFERLSAYEYPWAAACTMLGLLFMLGIDAFSADVAEAARRARRIEVGEKGSDEESTEHAAESHGHAHFAPSVSAFSKKALTAQLLEWSVLVHSLIIGADLGVQTAGSGLAALTLVLAVHQLFEGAALGSVVAACAELSPAHRARLALAFCCTTPAGVLCGIWLSSRGGAESPHAALMAGVLDGLCAGMLLQMSMALLADELGRPELLHEGGSLKRELFALACLGCLGMGVLAVWA